jgi:hypothetical protein
MTTCPYTDYINKSKAHKDIEKVKTLVKWLIVGIRKHLTTKFIAERLNKVEIFSINGKRHTANSVAMQLLKLARRDPESSAVFALSLLIDDGVISDHDLELLQKRVRS